jgi:hypothetical protein
LCELAGIALLIYGYRHEEKVIAWEQKMFCKVKKFIRRQLRKSKRIVAWAEGTTELDNSQIWSSRR